MFFKQLLHAKIPKPQKDSQIIIVFLHFWDRCVQKQLLKHWRIQPLQSYCANKLDHFGSIFLMGKFSVL